MINYTFPSHNWAIFQGFLVSLYIKIEVGVSIMKQVSSLVGIGKVSNSVQGIMQKIWIIFFYLIVLINQVDRNEDRRNLKDGQYAVL
ncbi:hypothetical protein PRUPE_1G424600 [Prunus persica]|uniref:Uncharacterized protein n=1 Tax=Prunus persica TaxID=3760 RepID=A0A251RBU8_PRUPE|nr:hypothetical protein PRUPE_1G424600 [Prunus persica]